MIFKYLNEDLDNMFYIISLRKGYGTDLGIGGLGIEEAALYGPDNYWSLKLLERKFGVNYKDEPFLKSLTAKERRQTPLLDFSLYDYKDKEELRRLKNIFRAVARRTLKRVNNFVSVYSCKNCNRPAEIVTVGTSSNRDGQKYFFDSIGPEDYFCVPCKDEMFVHGKVFDIQIVELNFDSTFNFPRGVQYELYRILRGATGFDSRKMGGTKEERKKYCQDLINSLVEKTGTPFLLNPTQIKLSNPRVPKLRRRKRHVPESSTQLELLKP